MMIVIVLLNMIVFLWGDVPKEDRRYNLRLRSVPKESPIVCPICHDYMSASPTTVIPPCLHSFHRNCIESWLARDRLDCPVCRLKTTMDVSSIPRLPEPQREYQGWEFGIFDAFLECLRCLGRTVPSTYMSHDDQ